MNLLTELLFPRRCPICDKPVDKLGRYICNDCQEKVRYITTPYCMKCGKQLCDDAQEYCKDCINTIHVFEKARALFEYDSLKQSIYKLKYEGRREYSEYFGKQLAKHLGDEIRQWSPQALVPIPLHKKRLKKRGYNQALYIARALGKEMNLPVLEQLLFRQKETMPQKELNGKERQNNLKNAFKIGQNDVKLKTIIIIDDIYTTGSTMDAAAQCLKDAGIEQVYCISLTVGRGI